MEGQEHACANLTRAGFFFGGLSVACAVWTYFRLPETGGRTYEELDILFANKVAARKFAKYEVDAYEADGNKAKMAN